MTLLLLLAALATSAPLSVTDNVHTVRVGTTPGGIELCTAISISPRHAVALCLFSTDDSVSVETADGIVFPDSMVLSPDLGLVVMGFEDEVFDYYQEPSVAVPARGEQIVIVGQGLSGIIEISGRAIEQYPDGSFLISAELRDGLMGAAVFSERGEFLGLISGMIRPSRQFPDSGGRDYLVLYPGQIWYMWAKLVILERDFSEYSFGVTALSSISLVASEPSGIQIVSVSAGSMAWECGLRPGDLVTHIDGTPVYHPETLRGLLILSEDTLKAQVERHNYLRELLIPPFE
jgi:S1-C subfamily serine protease